MKIQSQDSFETFDAPYEDFPDEYVPYDEYPDEDVQENTEPRTNYFFDIRSPEQLKKEAVELKYSEYTTAAGFFLDIRSAYKPETSIAEMDMIEKYREPTVLTIDEFGNSSGAPWEYNVLFELINRRCDDMKETTLIAIQDCNEFIKMIIGPLIASRIKERRAIIKFGMYRT